MNTLTSFSAAETHQFARDFAATLRRGDVVALSGELGAGKTKFVQGVAEWFRVTELVTSPTFVLLNRYAGRDVQRAELLLYHFDLYRVRTAAELYDLGFEEFVNGDGIALIEWAERFPLLLPSNRIEVRLRHGQSEHERTIEVERVEASVSGPMKMKFVLGLETSSAVCSVGIVDERGREFERKFTESHIHSEKILTLVSEVCEQARVELNEVSAIAVSVGPGSFTGLRIGVSTAKGLSFSTGAPIVRVPTFDAMIAQVSKPQVKMSSRVAVCIDAKQGDWYWQKFAVEGMRSEAMGPAAVLPLAAALEELNDVTMLVTDRPQLFQRTNTCDVREAGSLFSGAAIARIGIEMHRGGHGADAATLEPMYLKDFIVRTAAKPVLQ